jgi:hypothetical protein
MIPRAEQLAMALALLAWARPASGGGAIDVVAQEAALSLGQPPASSVVVAAPVVSDQPLAHSDELALRIAALVTGRIGAGAHTHRQVAQLATARALAGRASALVYLQTEIVRGDLRATVDVYPSTRNAWDRIRNPLPSPIAHAFASAKVDAEVRAFLAPLVLEQAAIHRAQQDEGQVLAIACGDVDGDGGNELLLVSRTRIALGRVRGERFVPERAAAWSTLAPRLPVPMREPLGTATVQTGSIQVGSTDRGSFALTPDFVGHKPLAGLPAWSNGGPVCLRPEPSAGAFDGAPIDCAVSRDTRPKMAVPSPRFDAFASTSFVDRDGHAHGAVAVREPSGKLKLRIDDTPVVTPDGTFGAQLAVGDLDQDGEPDLATTTDGPDDALVVSSWTANEFRTRLRIPAPAGVRALAVCPPELAGEPVLVAVVGDEVWLVRATPTPPRGPAADGTSPPERGRN